MDLVETSLRNANAEKYIEKFRNNGIDASMLTTLTNEDLEVIGITEEHLKQQILECFKTLPTTIQKITQPTIENVYVQLVLHQMSHHLKSQFAVLSCAINRKDIVKGNIKLKKGTESLLHCIESLENSILQLENLLLIHDDHFIHFFAPTNLAPIPKHVVFILDISISMVGPKLDQVKTAMTHILAELKEFDLFHIVEFGSRIKIIDLDNVGGSRSYTYEEVNKFSENTSLPLPKLALQQHILSANNAVKEMWVDGATDILSALKTGVTLIRLAKLLPTTGFRQPLIFFLTDGRSDTEYEINSTEILRIVTQQNVGTANIYALAFGDYADNNLLALLGALNKGVMKQIYSAQDAASQLRDFYNQISTPLLSNIKFNYPMAVTSVTKRNFDVYFKGSELVVSGKIVSGSSPLPNITATGAHPNPPFTAQTESTDLDLARFWAHLTIQQLLEESKTASNGADLKKTAEKLALNYSLVTPLSTLVIKQPGSSIPINIGPPFTESVPSSLLKPSYRDPIPTLPWLGNLLDDDGTFKGYGLALNETTDDFTSCPRTPLGGTGNCKLLHECLQIHNTLQDYKTFKKYFCNSNFNVGVCCPRRANRRHSG